MARASVAAENAAVGAITALAGYVSLHTADPGTTGASEVAGGTYARVAVTWGSPSAGQAANTNSITINVPASTTASYFGLWSASTSGTYYIGGLLTPAVVTGGSAGTAPIAIGALVVPAS